SMICWFNFAPVAPIEFDLALDPRHVFRALSLPGAQRLELLVALLEILEFGGRDGRTNAEARRHSDLTGLALVSAVGEPRKRPHCLMCLGYGETKRSKSRTHSSASAGLEPTGYSVTDTYRWGRPYSGLITPAAYALGGFPHGAARCDKSRPVGANGGSGTYV